MKLRPTLPSPLAAHYLRPGGPWDVPDLDQLLRTAPRRDGAVLVDDRRRLDATEVEDRVAALAGGLAGAGAGRGDVVAWQLPNSVEAVLLTRACWRIGAVAAPLHHRAGGAELDEMVGLLEPAVLLADPASPLHGRPGTIAVDDGEGAWAALRAGDPVRTGAARGEDLALVQFTSGSTGRPKAVLQTHRALAAKSLQMAAVHGLTAADATLIPAPIAHISGMLNGILVPGVAGMRVVLVDRWDAGTALEVIGREGISFMIGPPTLFLGLLAEPGFTPAAVAPLRVVSTGATNVTPEFVATAQRDLGAFVKRSYGCTEAPTISTSAEGDPWERAQQTDGRVLGATEIRLVDPATGQDRTVGDTGEVWVRGPELFAGYARQEETDAAVVDGWFRTGDLGRLDEGGWLTIVGRTKDLIIRGGENISPTEVERVLERHPGVRQAVVVGVPDERMGERVAAFLLGDGSLDAAGCRRWFEDQGVARFKAPEVVEHLDEVPVLSLGKPDRAALRDRWVHEHGPAAGRG